MADESIQRISGVQSDTVKTQAAIQAGRLGAYNVTQEGSQEALSESIEPGAFNALTRRFEPLETKMKKKSGAEEDLSKIKDKKIAEIKRAEDSAEFFQKKNPELRSSSLLLLRSRLARGDGKDDILRKLLEIYPDYSLADEALDYLAETADKEFHEAIRQAKEELNKFYQRQIVAGKNMAAEARNFASQGLGSPTALRDLYRNITGNPREPSALFEELNSTLTYEKMHKAIEFLLHSLGADLKSKGPSISRAELHRLLTECRTLQAILGLYRFFKSRMKLMEEAFKRAGISFKPNFEHLSKIFMKYLKERYPSADKALALARDLGIPTNIAAQIIIFTQMRDGTRYVPPKLFQSEKQRQDILMSFIEAIEELDEKLAEEKDK